MCGWFLAAIDFEHWVAWIIPLAGLLSAGLTLLVGRAWLRKRHVERIPTPKPVSPVPDPFPKPEGPVPDPFTAGSRSEKRRAFRRGGTFTRVLVSDALARAEPALGWVLDRSVEGLCVLVDNAVSENTILSVRARDAPENTPWVQVQVRRCQAKDGQWEVGTAFVRTPPWSVLLLFG